MKRILLTASLSLISAAAFAQSSVNVWGRLNVSAEQIKYNDGSKEKSLENSSSRLGFRGVEDLGGGLKAGFAIEHGFDPTTGTASSQFWGRGSEVYLQSNFGTLRIGNFTSEAYYATADYISLHNHDTGTSADRLYAYLPNNTNKVSYRTPEFSGFTGEVAVAEAQANGAAYEFEKSYDVALNYNVGAFAGGFGYQKLGDANQWALRGLYTFGGFTVGAYYQLDDNGWGRTVNPTTGVFGQTGKRDTFRLSGMYALGANEFHLNYGSSGDYDNISNSGADQWTVAYGYNLSKRTRLYAFYTKVDQDANNFYIGDFKSSLAAGIRHNF